MTFQEYNEKFQSFVSDLNENIRKAIEMNEEEIVALNKEQMQTGKNIDGNVIGVYRSVVYAAMKKDMGSRSPFRIVDLKLTGDFQGAMAMETDDQQYFIYSTDDKAGMLAEKYDKIFGLTKDSQQLAKVMNTRALGKLLKEAVR